MVCPICLSSTANPFSLLLFFLFSLSCPGVEDDGRALHTHFDFCGSTNFPFGNGWRLLDDNNCRRCIYKNENAEFISTVCSVSWCIGAQLSFFLSFLFSSQIYLRICSTLLKKKSLFGHSKYIIVVSRETGGSINHAKWPTHCSLSSACCCCCRRSVPLSLSLCFYEFFFSFFARSSRRDNNNERCRAFFLSSLVSSLTPNTS